MARFEILDKSLLTDLSVEIGPEKPYGDISLFFLRKPLFLTLGRKCDGEYSYVSSSYHCVERRNRTFESRGESIAIDVIPEHSELLSELGAILHAQLLEKNKQYEEFDFTFVDELNERIKMKTMDDKTKIVNVRTGKEMPIKEVTQGSCVHLLWQIKTVWVNKQNGTAGCVPKIHGLNVVEIAAHDDDVVDGVVCDNYRIA